MTTEHRRAPRRKIVEVSREGAWGKVKYKHLLECGHTEVRPRASSTPSLACAWCLRVDVKQKEINALSLSNRGPYLSNRGPYVDMSPSMASDEITLSKTRALLSSKFGLPLDSVDIISSDVNGNLEINYAIIFLSSGDVARLMKP